MSLRDHEGDPHRQQPDRRQVEAKLADLASGKITREEAATWAEQFDLTLIDDELAVEALELLSGADMVSTDRPYLYGPEDFRAWLAWFRRCTGAQEDSRPLDGSATSERCPHVQIDQIAAPVPGVRLGPSSRSLGGRSGVG